MESTATAIDSVWRDPFGTAEWVSCDCYDILGLRVMVRSDSLEFTTQVRRALRCFPTSLEDRPPDATYSLVKSPTKKQAHCLYHEGSIVARGVHLWFLFRRLECQLDFLLSELVDGPLLLHAGAVSRDGSGIIMPGSSGSGKSSLTLALIQRGYSYFSDEIAVVDPETRELGSFPKPLSIKNKSVFPDLARRRDLWFGPETDEPEAVWYIHPGDLSLLVTVQPVPIRHIIFPSYGPHGDSQLVPLSPGKALRQLATNSINFSQLGGEAFHLLAAVVKGSRCFSLKSSDLETSVASIDRLTGVGA